MKRIGNALGLLLLLTAIIQIPSQALAASNSIGVNPRRDYTIDPGGKVSETLLVNNLSKTDGLTVKMEVTDFKPQDQTGTPSLLIKETQPTKWSLKPYLSVPGQYTVAAGKSTDLPFTIEIPKTVGAGSYYSAIRYVAVNPATGQNVSLTGSAVTLIFVRVTGEAKSNLSLEKFGAFTPNSDMSDGTFATFFGSAKPKYISYLLRNNGSIAEQPVGSVMIKDMFGTQYQLINDANPRKNLVLLGQTRRIDLCLNEEKKQIKNASTGGEQEQAVCNDPSLKPGRYTASIDLVYGGQGNSQNELKQTTTFWYLPMWFVLVMLLIMLVIVGGIVFVVRKLRGRNKPTYGSRRR